MVSSVSQVVGERSRKCKPFIKWVGGKTQLLSELISRIPSAFQTYHEPFIGGGAFFFALSPRNAVLSDINEELINCYRVVQSDVDMLIEVLREHKYNSDYFYEIRNVDRCESYRDWSVVQRAARFIYLNKSCFNGLYRVNSKGQFNVPFGRYSNPKIVNPDNLYACNQVLQGHKLLVQHFSSIVERVQKHDFVYFDPPYVPLSATADFTSYAKDGFDFTQQEHLRDVCRELDKKGVYFMLSNSHTEVVVELYREFFVETVSASRAVNSNPHKRGKVEEVIVRNFQNT